MGFHTFDADGAARLEDDSRFRYCSREELLGNLAVGPEATVLDVGSGTGFFTDEIAPFVGRVVAADLQAEMQAFYREKGVPENVDQVLADAEAEPLRDESVDAAVATMVFHEAAGDRSLEELFRVLVRGGRFVAVDWSARGRGDAGPPRSERFDSDEAASLLREAGFAVEGVRERGETFLVVAKRPGE